MSNADTYAAILSKAAKLKLKQAKASRIAGMVAMYAGDARDMFDAARMIAEGNREAARDKVSKMDTAARDEIPKQVYEYLFGD